MPRRRLPLVLYAAIATSIAQPDAQAAAATRQKSLAQFDAGFAHCEKLHPDMRGQRDLAYAGVYRLKLDDALRAQLAQARGSAAYKADRKRARAAIAKNLAASAVAQRADLQCQALRREIAKNAANSAAAPAAGAASIAGPRR
ncbi:MAG: hypothetical protein HS128_04165 [Ideonella sp.]|nr:hypothetical protein [Ideonella sp.]MCC7455819.1 hypothetical protein [Nitrospira sp.]